MVAAYPLPRLIGVAEVTSKLLLLLGVVAAMLLLFLLAGLLLY